MDVTPSNIVSAVSPTRIDCTRALVRRLPIVESVDVVRSHPPLRVYRGAVIEFLEYVVMRRHCNNLIQGDYRTPVMRDDIPLDACIGTGRQSRSALFPTAPTVETLGADRTPMYSYPETLFSPAFHVLDIVASHIV